MPADELLRDTLLALRELPTHVATLTASVEHLDKRLDSHHEWIRDVETEAATARAEMRKELKVEIADVRAALARVEQGIKDGRRNVLVALIGFGGSIAAAFVAAAAALIVHFA